MVVKRIVVDIAAGSVPETSRFYQDLLGLEPVMDLGWITTLSSAQSAPVQLSIAQEGGGGAPVPDMSIEVEDVSDIYSRARAMEVEITYELKDEPWGVRRFFAKDPTGRTLNILSHL